MLGLRQTICRSHDLGQFMHRYEAHATKDLGKRKICGTFIIRALKGLDFNRFSRSDAPDQQ
jgi:hypothetical protein